MNVLVTGASGFLGSHIVDRCLALGYGVRALVRQESDLSYLGTLEGVEIARGELTDGGALRAALRGIECVHHAAARVVDYGSRAQFEETNVEGTRRLVEAAKREGVRRFVFVSSPSIFADDREHLDVDETIPYPARYANLYAATKAAAERLVLAANTEGFTACALRPRGIWGPRDYRGALPKLVARMRAGKLKDLSGGKPVLASLCHCRNAAEACVLASQSDRVGGHAYFVTDGVPVDLWSFLSDVAERLSLTPPTGAVNRHVLDAAVSVVEALWKIPMLAHRRSPPISRYALGLLTLSSTYSIAAASRDFGYAPVVRHREGLDDLQRWIAANGGVDAFVRYVA